ncbi:hypothetical protein AM501_20340 [Aneurinibacillus migulanus]|uniref:Uncharacterized protein n=1 Tax=Aneurinibacillus migulanus TaxID=47500 RepID=A0A0D1V3G0_ANEMI|nr:hypothetical protein [Aneurinibacillus migulanus]KIV53919.1 hypothetical protein TS65_19935 [Aneurinibacillus migulanus]KIV56036.1 hypothetical protein TS64_11120 [Aneurinibacillus migulanus]KON96070.1 hypothetical protein AF333_11790 [Aneurinibacillus migulanus]KPD06560.1 hypothetical protein AM501_20340 [Aneurinibacillus migulanus]MCP1356651.1 hypothetical protein [Aneurinibacillus migulanus]
MKNIQEALSAGETIELTDLFNDRFQWDASFDLMELLNSGHVKYNGVKLTREESLEIIKALKILAA